jgi:hypothetical protein
MPIEHLVDQERRLVEVIFLGAVSRQEIEAFRHEVESLAPHALAYDALVDLRHGSLDLTTAEIRDVANGAEMKGWPRSRCALVAPYGTSYTDLKLFELWSSRGPRQYRVFRSLGEACGWLGLDRAGLCLEETVHG